jgi:cyclase
MRLQQFADGVYACLQADKGTGYSNSGLISLGSGLVIDTFFDLPHTRRLIEHYARVWKRPAAQLVNTHHNGDHCWGNQLFRGAEIIGHRRCAELLTSDDPEALQAVVRGDFADPGLDDLRLRLSDFDFSGIQPTPPTTVFDDELRIETCETPVHLRYLGPAHTSSDVIVHLPEQRIVFAGDILFRLCTPFGWEGSHARWIAALDSIIALEPSIIVPGHGPPCGIEGVEEMKAYLLYIYAEAQRHFDAERSAFEAAKRIDLGPYFAWTEPDRLVFNVERAYSEFRGEPFDAPLDVLQRFRDMYALRRYWADRRSGAQARTLASSEK